MPRMPFDPNAYVTAEHAPIGVQVWPTIRSDAAPMYTLRTVSLIRVQDGGYVQWTFQNGDTRVFQPGTRVGVQLPADWVCEDCGEALQRRATPGCAPQCDSCSAKRTAEVYMRATGSVSATATVGDATHTATR